MFPFFTQSVTCILQVGVYNQLAGGGLTKILTFVPYYMITNDANVSSGSNITGVSLNSLVISLLLLQYPIEFREETTQPVEWMTINPQECCAFWPISSEKRKKMVLRVVGEEEVSTPFSVVEQHTTLLKFNNKVCGN